MSVQEELEKTRANLTEAQAAGTWTPPPPDDLSQCEFIRAGFRSWGLEAADKSWRLTLSKLDFGSKEPSALLTVHAPHHATAFPDLDWWVFNHSIGTNGGTNFNQAAKALAKLGGAEDDWRRRLNYLIGRAKLASAGANNGTFSTSSRPRLEAQMSYLFVGKLRVGRTISLFGPGSAGKTTIADALIASACSGKQIVPGWIPDRQMASLILDWDEGDEEEKVRLGAICNAYDIDLSAGYHYKRQTRPLYDVADEIGKYIVDNGIGFVVVSPMGRAQRNFGENITAPVDEVHEILRSFGTTNLLIDHVTGDGMRGGANREFGSVRKRDNVRGSYAVDVQSEDVGVRVLVIRNTKADALGPRVPDQAVRIEYDPPEGNDDHTYTTIRFMNDEVSAIRTAGGPSPILVAPGESQTDRLERILRDHGDLSTMELCALGGFAADRVRDIVRRAREKGVSIRYEGGVYTLAESLE